MSRVTGGTRLSPAIGRAALVLTAWAVMILAALWLTACAAGTDAPDSATGVLAPAGGASGDAAGAAPSQDDDTTTATAIAEGGEPPSGYLTFVINVHDTEHVNESADTLLRLIDIYQKYGVRGDFYLTAPIAELYQLQRPDVVARLKESGMGISYHVRPPHPLYNGFDQLWAGLDEPQLNQTLLDYETYRLDLETGGLQTDQPGGYTYVMSLFGSAPVVASAPVGQQEVRAAAEKMYAGLGAGMTVRYHEEGTDPGQPFAWVNGLLIRPSDFSVTRWGGSPGSTGKEPFWWNFAGTDKAAQYDPASYLRQRLAEWWAGGPSRAPFITSLIHENNFYRSGAEGWTLSYYADTGKEQPLPAPFDLDAADPSQPRPEAQQEAIWAAYEEMVAWAAANLEVVTSGDIVEIARSQA